MITAENRPGQSTVAAVDRVAARRVAIRLRGLSVGDRSWILERLEAGQRRAVESAENELQKILGSEVLDFSLFLDAQDEPGKRQKSVFVDHRINGLEFEELRAVLDRLPAVWVKALLDAGIWNEGDKYQERLSAKQKQRLKKVAAASLPPRVARALADSLVESVTESGAHHG